MTHYQRHISLRNHSNNRVGGAASFFYQAQSPEQLRSVLQDSSRSGVPLFILGGGTNVLFSDNGFNGIVLKIALEKLKLQHPYRIQVGAGIAMHDLVDFCRARGLEGLEWAGGLPGTFGGAVRGNAGAFGGQMQDVIRSVTSMKRRTGELVVRNNDSCAFNYRTSIFKQRGDEVIVEAELQLAPGDKRKIAEVIDSNIAYRAQRHPMEYPNHGSTFKNVPVKSFATKHYPDIASVVKRDPFPVVPTAYLIARSGLAGVSLGGAMVSAKHPNFLINHLAASSDDMRSLIQMVKTEVGHRYGVELQEEIEYA